MSEKQIDARLITRRYFGDFEDPSVINSGWCFVWAWMARLHFGTGAGLCWVSEVYRGREGGRGHAFIKHGRRYYDSDRPDGVTRFADLPAVRWVGRGRVVHIDAKPDDFYLAWQASPGGRVNFRTQGLKPWPTKPPKRKPRPPRGFRTFERLGVGASA